MNERNDCDRRISLHHLEGLVPRAVQGWATTIERVMGLAMELYVLAGELQQSEAAPVLKDAAANATREALLIVADGREQRDAQQLENDAFLALIEMLGRDDSDQAPTAIH